MGELEEMLQHSRRYHRSKIEQARMSGSQQRLYDAEESYKQAKENIFDVCEEAEKSKKPQ